MVGAWMAEVRFNGAALKSLALQASEADLRVRANRVLNAARRGCPVDQGQLRASLAVSFTKGSGGGTVARIGSNLPYAIMVHEGTGVYGPSGTPIVPRTKKALRWPTKNNSGSGRRRYQAGSTRAYTFSRSSKGVPGRPFLRNALDAAR